jgi:MADS-box transcription factor
MSMDERPIKPPLLNTDSAIRKLPQRKGHSIFTPVEDNRSILSQHLASFEPEPLAVKADAATNGQNRARSVEPTALSRNNSTVSPPRTQRPSPPSNLRKVRTASDSSAAEPEFTPPSRSNSFKIGATRTRGPRLTVQIPDGGSEPESATGATGESNSPRNHDTVVQPAPHRPNNPLSAVVLPPPSPSASALLSAGATGPPNPFARPVPQQNVVETPASALPSRFLNTEFLHSPSNFYQDWPFRGDSNTLPSPNFATPIHGSGPSFLREENPSYGTNSSQTNGATKRKSPDYGPNGETEGSDVAEAKRPKIEV